jgi:hypothetical protein
MDPDKRSAWLQKLDEECPYQVVLPRRQLTDDNEIMNFLLLYAGRPNAGIEGCQGENLAFLAFFDLCFRAPNRENPLLSGFYASLSLGHVAKNAKLLGGILRLHLAFFDLPGRRPARPLFIVTLTGDAGCLQDDTENMGAIAGAWEGEEWKPKKRSRGGRSSIIVGIIGRN